MFSRVVYKHRVRLRPRLYEKYNPMTTREEAHANEEGIYGKISNKGIYCLVKLKAI